MTTIKKHLELEKSKAKPNTLRITELEKVLSKGTLTFEEWVSLGRFTPAETYVSDKKILKSTREVIEYVGDEIIQVLKTGEFYHSSKLRDKDLDVVEKAVWRELCEKLWCENC